MKFNARVTISFDVELDSDDYEQQTPNAISQWMADDASQGISIQVHQFNLVKFIIGQFRDRFQAKQVNVVVDVNQY